MTLNHYMPRLQAVWRKVNEHRTELRLRRAIAGFKPLRVVIGASGTRYDGWLSVEYPMVDIADRSNLRRFFTPASVQAILAEHVLEHLTAAQAARAAQNIAWLLAPGAQARIAVPDALHPDPEYIEYCRPGGTGAGSDDHKVFYEYRSLSALLSAAGLEVRRLEWFDENGEFHFVPWDPSDGMIVRSARFDARNRTKPTAYTSLIVDAVKSPMA